MSIGHGTETRITSDSGGAKGSKAERFDLIPPAELGELARQYGHGANKYEKVNGVDNWANGYDWSLSYAAMQRHAHAFWSGEDCDPETGEKHVIAVAWHALTLAHFMNRSDLAKFDDRQAPRLKARALIAEAIDELCSAGKGDDGQTQDIVSGLRETLRTDVIFDDPSDFIAQEDLANTPIYDDMEGTYGVRH